VTSAIVRDGLDDVVTGFGLLNEPFGDCNHNVYKQFLENGLHIVRETLGESIKVFVSDMFLATYFNDGTWWLDPTEYHDTLLDTHFYHVFASSVRTMSPREHLARVCNPEDAQEEITSCCYEDATDNNVPSQGGVKRISTEWSAAFDAMPGELLQVVMQGIAASGTAPDFHRRISPERQAFLKKFVEAQIVAYEAADTGLSQGWFYWTWKVEGGAFAEWDFSRGLFEGWIPPIAPSNTSSQELYGTCNEILLHTNNTMDVVHPFPWGDPDYWEHDDFVPSEVNQNGVWNEINILKRFHWFFFGLCVAIALLTWHFFRKRRRKWQYTSI